MKELLNSLPERIKVGGDYYFLSITVLKGTWFIDYEKVFTSLDRGPYAFSTESEDLETAAELMLETLKNHTIIN